MKKIIKLIFIAALVFIFIPNSKAAEFLITCNDSGCSNDGQVFIDYRNVFPGQSITRSLEVVNNAKDKIDLVTKPVKNSGTDEAILSQISIRIEEVGGAVKFIGTADNFLNQSIDLGSVAAGKVKAIDFTFSLADVSNEYQGKIMKFDLPVYLATPGNSSGDGVGGGATTSPIPTVITGAVAAATDFINQALETVLGDSDIASRANDVFSESGAVAGSSSFNWWWPLILQFGLSIIYLVLRKKKTSWQIFTPLILIAIVSQIISRIIGCPLNNHWCSYSWLANLIVLVFSLIACYRLRY